MKTEAPVGESHVGPKKSVLAVTGFTRQAVGVRLGCGALDHRSSGRPAGVDNDSLSGLNGRDHVMN